MKIILILHIYSGLYINSIFYYQMPTKTQLFSLFSLINIRSTYIVYIKQHCMRVWTSLPKFRKSQPSKAYNTILKHSHTIVFNGYFMLNTNCFRVYTSDLGSA